MWRIVPRPIALGPAVHLGNKGLTKAYADASGEKRADWAHWNGERRVARGE